MRIPELAPPCAQCEAVRTHISVEPVPPQRVEYHVHLPWRTVARILLTALLVWAALRVWPELVFLSISLLLAVALDPLVGWAERRGLSRGLSVMLLATCSLTIVIGVVAIVLPPLADQLADLIGNFPAFQARVERRLPRDNPMLSKVVDQIFLLPSSAEVTAELNKPLIWGRAAVSAAMTTFFVMIATFYLLLDGRRLYAWLLAFVPRAQREKMALTVPEVSAVVYAYVRGQVITSIMFGSCVAVLLVCLGVPAVVPLAVLAALCDVVPVVGIIIATVPAALLALTISPLTAVFVLGFYVLYHLFESYYIVPRIYGSSLRLSTLAVLLALIVGGTLQGVLGAVMVLPMVAAYPIIERIWLGSYLGKHVVADHNALARGAGLHSDTAVELVLQGEKHDWE
jgi:predicted PurR-regulated permease PerM